MQKSGVPSKSLYLGETKLKRHKRCCQGLEQGRRVLGAGAEMLRGGSVEVVEVFRAKRAAQAPRARSSATSKLCNFATSAFAERNILEFLVL